MNPKPDRWLRLAWRTWFIYALLMMGLVLASLPILYAALQQPCDRTQGFCASGQLTPGQFTSLQASGLSPGWHAAWNLAFIFIFDSTLALALAFLLYRRQGGNWAALALAIPVLSHGVAIPGGLLLLERAYPWLQPLTRLPEFLVLGGWFFFFLIFPDGRFVPRWGRWLLPVVLGLALIGFIYNQYGDLTVVSTAVSTGFGLSFVVAFLFQIYRYLRVSGPVERAQARWVIYSFFLLGALLWVIVPAVRRVIPVLSQPDSLHAAYFDHVTSTLFGPILLLLGFWVAILRERLWDIDVIIRKTLVYGVVTGLLALMYLGGVLLLQGLFSRLGAAQSPAALVLSTLAIAALFSPLRKRVQEAVDRRFYRKKYDAERVLADFTSKARDEVDIGRLGAALVGAVEETVQPVQASLWLRPVKDK